MTFAILCTVIFCSLSVSVDMNLLFHCLCIFMCLYSAYTVDSIILKESSPRTTFKEENSVIAWGKILLVSIDNRK